MHATFRVEEIHCGACAKRITSAIQAVHPGAKVRVDISSGTVDVLPAGDIEKIVKAINDAGFPAARA